MKREFFIRACYAGSIFVHFRHSLRSFSSRHRMLIYLSFSHLEKRRQTLKSCGNSASISSNRARCGRRSRLRVLQYQSFFKYISFRIKNMANPKKKLDYSGKLILAPMVKVQSVCSSITKKRLPLFQGTVSSV